MSLSKLSIAALALAGNAVAVQPIIKKGMKLFYENGTQFFIKGIAYQVDEDLPANTEFIDPLADEDICARDVPLLQELGVNTIRTYAIDAEADHSGCMNLLNEAGIYLISDLSQPQESINRDSGSWTVELFDRYKAVIDELAQYDNTIGFFAGNEVTNNASNTLASAYVKAAVRDTKQYIIDQEYRWMGVGYSNNDDTDIREDIAHYFNCGTEEDSVDFWGYNIYSWCGESNMEDSGYNDQITFFENYGVPVFFSEYGCNQPGGADARIWQETGALFGDEMTAVFSGGMAFKYHNESNDFGVVQYENGRPNRMDNFEFLAEEHNNASPSAVNIDSYDPSFTTPTDCPAPNENWEPSSVLPPTPNQDLCDCAAAASLCAPVSDIDDEDMADIFDFICGADDAYCAGIHSNATTGVHGAYSMCDNAHKLTVVMGVYYDALSNSADACDHGGLGEVKENTAESSCDEPLASASAHNEEAATATAGNPSSTGGSDSDSDDDDENFGVAGAVLTRVFALGDVAVGLYMVAAMGAGAAVAML